MTTLADHVIPLGNYSGTIMIGFGAGQGGNPLVVPDGATSCDIQIARCTSQDLTIWPDPAVVVDIVPQISIDNAQTWVECGASRGSRGGIKTGKDGVTEVPFVQSGGALPAALSGIPRLYRCSFSIIGVLHSFGNVVVTP